MAEKILKSIPCIAPLWVLWGRRAGHRERAQSKKGEKIVEKIRITKRYSYWSGRVRVTVEKITAENASLKDALELAKKQGADLDEVKEELDEMGITISSVPGYYFTVV